MPVACNGTYRQHKCTGSNNEPASDKVLAQLGAQKRKLSQMDTFGLYPSGNKVTEKPEILFARMDIKEVMAKVAELHPVKEEVKEEEKGIDIELLSL